MKRTSQHSSYLAGLMATGEVCAWSISPELRLNPATRLFGNKQKDTGGGK